MADTTTEKLITATKLARLLKEKSNAGTRVAAIRGTLDETIKKAISEDFLDPIAFGIVAKIAKIKEGDEQKAAWIWRHLLVYGDMLGLGDQADLLDAIDTKADAEEPASEKATRKARTNDDPIEEVLANGGKAALERFRLGLQDVDSVTRMQKGYGKFVEDYPQLQVQAEQIVAARQQALSGKPN